MEKVCDTPRDQVNPPIERIPLIRLLGPGKLGRVVDEYTEAMGLYQEQKEYFRQAYLTGDHGWPVHEPTSFVVRSLRQIRERMKGEAGRILDLGCGEGRHTFASVREGFEAVGLDYQVPALDRARAIAEKN
ncbi:MAG TPA: methyltransferase domain-containing protein, partial [Nitrospiria bacterium]